MDQKTTQNNKIYAACAYLFNFFGALLVLLLKKDDKFAHFHAKQALILYAGLIPFYICVLIVSGMAAVVSFKASLLLMPLMMLGYGSLWFVGLYRAITGSDRPLPIVGEILKKYKL